MMSLHLPGIVLGKASPVTGSTGKVSTDEVHPEANLSLHRGLLTLLIAELSGFFWSSQRLHELDSASRRERFAWAVQFTKMAIRSRWKR